MCVHCLQWPFRLTLGAFNASAIQHSTSNELLQWFKSMVCLFERNSRPMECWGFAISIKSTFPFQYRFVLHRFLNLYIINIWNISFFSFWKEPCQDISQQNIMIYEHEHWILIRAHGVWCVKPAKQRNDIKLIHKCLHDKWLGFP